MNIYIILRKIYIYVNLIKGYNNYIILDFMNILKKKNNNITFFRYYNYEHMPYTAILNRLFKGYIEIN